MLRAYQLSSSANRGQNDSSSPWTLKDRNENQDNNVRTRTVSTKILGLGIVLVGVLALAVGLIMGLEFPKYVYEKNKEAQCVLHMDHENYRSWQSGSQWKRKVKIYYWILTNEDGFLYDKQAPQFEQRGPYIYTETEEKYNIHFAVTEVSFRKRIHYTFDKESTWADCAGCREHDKLTLLNRWYLQKVFSKGGDTQLAWECIPKYVTLDLTNQGLARSEGEPLQILEFNRNISLLGNFNEQTTLSPPLSNLSFGTWFSSNKDAFPNVINFTRTTPNSHQFSDSHVLAIYNVFTNSTLLYGSIYSKDVEVSDAQNSLHVQCEKWANYLCSDHRRSKTYDVDLLQCGVVYILHKCHENNFDSSEVSTILHNSFCLHQNICLNFSSMPEVVGFEFRRMLSLFLIQLTSNVNADFLPSEFYDLVISHNQSSLAQGFEFVGNEVVPMHPAKGLLYQDLNREDDSFWKLYTCLKDRKMKNNMRMKEYNRLRYAPEGLFPERSVNLASYTDFARPCSQLHACVNCGDPEEEVKVFVEDLVSPVTFIHKGRSSISGVDVQEYEMANNTFVNTSRIPGVSDIQDVSPFTGFLAWIGTPNVDAVHGYTLTKPLTEPSLVQVEPVTGRIWHKDIKLQWNVGVSEKSGKAWDREMSDDFLSVPLPIAWYQRVMTISDDEVDEYERVVLRLMAASCGGLIAFSIIAVVIAIIGVIICIYPFKPNKINPVFDEAINNNVNGRH